MNWLFGSAKPAKVKSRKASRKRKTKSVYGSYRQVWNGTKQKVRGTKLTKKDLMKNKNGKIISKKKHQAGKRAYKRNGLAKWNKAMMAARKKLGITGFVPIKKGTEFYQETMRMYKNDPKW